MMWSVPGLPTFQRFAPLNKLLQRSNVIFYKMRREDIQGIVPVILLLMMRTNVYAQHLQQNTDNAESVAHGTKSATDTSSFLYACKKGHFNGNFRYFFMASDNKPGLTDYYANAIGGGIKYETALYKGFQFGVGGYFIFNIGSSDLTKPDPTTRQSNRYEIGLFDIQDPGNKNNINRLEELYIKYNWKKSQLVFGKQLINTPFINLQDGRMRPTAVGGLYGAVKDIKNTKIEGGFIYQVSPRSTVRWFKVGESIGINPQGINVDGRKSDYAGNVKSNGIALIGVTHAINHHLSFKMWDVFVENIFNTTMLQADFSYPLSNDNSLTAGFQYIRQDAIKDGGNSIPSKAYFNKNGKSNVWGAAAGWKNNYWQASVNYTRITDDGRFLMPREWGREPLFTFLPRERNDGFGDLDAYLAKASYTTPGTHVKIETGLGYYDLPDVHNYAMNKYGMPSYVQFNVDARYYFKGLLKGLEADFLFVHKWKKGDTYGNDQYEINKVNFSLWHLIFNYNF